MLLQLKTPPKTLPINLQNAKLHLRVDIAEEDLLIMSLIGAATLLAEKETKRGIISQTWKLYLDEAGATVDLPKAPLQSVTSIKTISSIESRVDINSAASQPILSIVDTAKFAEDDTVVVGRDTAREEELVILTIQDDESLTMTTDLASEHTALQEDSVEKYSLVSKDAYMVALAQDSFGRVRLRSGRSWPSHRGFSSFIVEYVVGYSDNAKDVPEGLKQAILQLLGFLYQNREAQEIPKGMRPLFWPFKILRI